MRPLRDDATVRTGYLALAAQSGEVEHAARLNGRHPGDRCPARARFDRHRTARRSNRRKHNPGDNTNADIPTTQPKNGSRGRIFLTQRRREAENAEKIANL